MEFREPRPASPEGPGRPAEAASPAENRRSLEAVHPRAPADTQPQVSQDWRGRLWRTSRGAFWNWD